MWAFFHRMASPKIFFDLSGRMIPWFLWSGLLIMVVGFVWGLAFSPPDYQQGETVRIFYLHVPTAFMSMACYMFMAITSAIGLVWRIKMAHMVAASAAPIGAVFTFLALFTGAVWGKPMWGTWWVWDARLTSELILLFLYIGFIAFQNAFDDYQTADKASAILALVGVVNIPIIHFSVEWWNTLHQGATLSKFEKPSIELSMLWPFLIVFVGINLYFAALVLIRTRTEVLKRERRSKWVRQMFAEELN
ncbi:MAG: heme ABC transporter permease [Pseudomonadota bacterium]